MLNLPRPSPQYDATNEAQARATLERNDKELMRKAADVVFVNRRCIIPSPNGNLWEIKVSNAGVVSATPL